jgi:asparagine synthase (glutamine-hydrolysing)
MIRHRGPDEAGIYLEPNVGIGNVRLSIIDLGGGQQPIHNEEQTLYIVFNGEIFNYCELRPDLEARGHRFETNSDTEVIIHLYEEYGPRCVERMNGQFAFAIWDIRRQTMFLARDRVGVCPLYYTQKSGAFIFGSEIKALLGDPRVTAEIDQVSLDQVFTFWVPLSPRTIFKDIYEIPPGHYMLIQNGRIMVEPYWQLSFVSPPAHKEMDTDYVAERLRDLLIEATCLRLRADVPVGAYLSGGLDSSTIASIIKNFSPTPIETFSVAFTDQKFDERPYQEQMANYLGTNHHVLECSHSDIGRVFPELIWHLEMPTIRTAPAPLFMLSQFVRQHGLKVVLTGEGADEFFGGYNIFKEDKVRRFWAKNPESTMRPQLIGRLYHYINGINGGPKLSPQSFKTDLAEVDSFGYSHLVRWHNTSRIKRFFSEGVRTGLNGHGNMPPAEYITWPDAYERWGPLSRAQYLEITIFLSQYLLKAQGDRVIMAHGVEGRQPFLDPEIMHFSNTLPASLKLHGLQEKYILKHAVADLIPSEIWDRPKTPYRAPIQHSFFNGTQLDYVEELLSPEDIERRGLFNPGAARLFVNKIKQGGILHENDEMALVGIISTQLLHQQFVENFELRPPLTRADRVKICRGPAPFAPLYYGPARPDDENDGFHGWGCGPRSYFKQSQKTQLETTQNGV